MAKTAYNELDYTAAVARLRALETRILGATELEKLLNASSVGEAVKYLANLGWKGTDDYEEMLQVEMRSVFDLIEELGGDEFLKTQRVRYDYHNLKVLIKSELTKQNGDHLLIDLGNTKLIDMKSTVMNRDYHRLSSSMREAIQQAYEQYARVNDVQLVDIILDRAMFKDLSDFAQKQPENKIRDIIKIQIDMHNIKTFLRANKMGKTHGFIENAIVEGGDLPKSFFSGKTTTSLESEKTIFEHTSYAKAFSQGAGLEIELDNIFLEKVKAARMGAFGLAPLAAYFWIKENEIQNVRIILTCKTAGINVDVIRQRLRGQGYVSYRGNR